MGAFAIFFVCLTFVYILYYTVMILMDIYGKKATKPDGEESFNIGGGAGKEENADQVLEKEDGGYEILGHDENLVVATPFADSDSVSTSSEELPSSPVEDQDSGEEEQDSDVSAFGHLSAVKEQNTAVIPEYQQECTESEMQRISMENPMDGAHKVFRSIITSI